MQTHAAFKKSKASDINNPLYVNYQNSSWCPRLIFKNFVRFHFDHPNQPSLANKIDMPTSDDSDPNLRVSIHVSMNIEFTARSSEADGQLVLVVVVVVDKML